MATVKDAKSEDRGERSLTSVRLLAGISADTLRRIEGACRWRVYRTGETIIERGDDSQDVYFLVAGTVHVMNFAASGRFVAYGVLGPGEFFGELAAIDGRPRPPRSSPMAPAGSRSFPRASSGCSSPPTTTSPLRF